MKALKVILLFITGSFIFTARATSASHGKRQKNVFFSGMETAGEITNPGSSQIEQGNLLVQRMVQTAQDITNDERVSGELTIETNACLNQAGTWGALWGTFVLQNPGGKWLAAWIGQKTTQGVTIYAMGYGAGTHAGLLANWTYTRLGTDSKMPFKIQGFIVKLSEPAALQLNGKYISDERRKE